MPVDLIKLQEQLEDYKQSIPLLQQELSNRNDNARNLFSENSENVELLQKNAQEVFQLNPRWRCALPGNEPLDKVTALPALPPTSFIIAADGSQINPDSHAALNFYLINVGWICLPQNTGQTVTSGSQPTISNELYLSGETISENQVAFERDIAEREYLNQLVETNPTDAEVTVTLSDGPLVIWTRLVRETEDIDDILSPYFRSLMTMQQTGTITAGYTDKPRARLIANLLETLLVNKAEFSNITRNRQLLGVTDVNLYKPILKRPGDRSPVFRTLSPEANKFKNFDQSLELHFFYMNVGTQRRQWIVRVEIPKWVADNRSKLDALHAILFDQCEQMGNTRYPYVLHRSHEEALVTREEKEQITNDLTLLFLNENFVIGQESFKSMAKNFQKSKRHSKHGRIN